MGELFTGGKVERGSTILYFPAVDGTEIFNDGKDEGMIDGTAAENRRFWNVIMGNGKRANFGYAFMGWDCEEIVPPYKIAPTGGTMAMVFANNPSLVAVRAEHFDFSQVPTAKSDTTGNYATFTSCTNLEVIEDIGLQPNFSYNMTFAFCGNLETIEKIRVNESTKFNNTFANSPKLENLTIDGVIGQNGFSVSNCPNLTAASIESIINALKPDAGCTVRFSPTAVNFTDEHKAAIEAKGWTCELK